MFTIPPKETEKVIEFSDKQHKIDKLFSWGLITETAKKKGIIKEFKYCDSWMGNPVKCDIVGYIPYNSSPDSPDTVVILVEGKLSKVMPAYLKEMQVGNTDLNVIEGELEVKDEVTLCEDKDDMSARKNYKEYDFVVIDFETANANMNSACSIGIVMVENNQIVDKKYFLIKPPTLQFDRKNIEIHGIRPEDVAEQDDFKGVWKQIEPYLAHNLLVAHNASFDMSVLKCCLHEYGISVPDTEYVCSIPISSYAFDKKVGNSLAERTELLGIKLENAHNALDDAVACAQLVIKTLEINNKTSLHKFLTRNRDINVKWLTQLTEQTTFKKSNSKISRFKNNVRIADLEATVDHIDKCNPVYDKVFVFTGELEMLSREEAMQSVLNLGGIVKSGVSKKINYLVVGSQDPTLVGEDGMSSKQRKAYELIQQGLDIQIIDEQGFMQIIGGNHDK